MCKISIVDRKYACYNPVIGYDPDVPLDEHEAAILLKEAAALCEKWLDEDRDLAAMIYALGTALKNIRDTAVSMHEYEVATEQ